MVLNLIECGKELQQAYERGEALEEGWGSPRFGTI
jgi:hypothetical protein